MFEFDYRLTPADLTTYRKAMMAHLKSATNAKDGASRWWRLSGLWLGGVLIAAAVFFVVDRSEWVDPYSVMIGAWLGLVLVVGMSMLHTRRLYASMYRPNGPNLARVHAKFDDTGMRTTAPWGTAHYYWQLFTDVTEGKDQVVLWIEPCQGFVVPRSAFADDASSAAFVAFVRERIAASGNGVPGVSKA